MSSRRAYQPTYLWHDGAFRTDLEVVVVDGAIECFRPTQSEPQSACEAVSVHGALLPGMANAHSHAFQRAMRGRTQIASGGDDNFWSWRQAMYETALGLDPDGVERIARLAFIEMLEAGFTRVGEFHYLHHAPDGSPYDNPNELAERVLAAADDVGIKITLLRVAYALGGFGTPASEAQRRFVEPDVATYLERVERLQALESAHHDHDALRVGLAPHSMRALGLDWLAAIDRWRTEHGTVCHMHLAEQVAELEAAQAAHGASPLRLLLDNTELVGPWFSAVHGTHFSPDELTELARRDAILCACPLTERDLGDGFLPARGLFERRVRVSIGTDSHCQIEPLEELRAIEYHERLREQRRNVLSDNEWPRPADWLWRCATTDGHASLGAAETWAPGSPFDAISIDLDNPAVLGCEPADLLSGIVFAGTRGLVMDVWVSGRKVVADGRHAKRDAAARDYVRTVQALRS